MHRCIKAKICDELLNGEIETVDLNKNTRIQINANDLVTVTRYTKYYVNFEHKGRPVQLARVVFDNHFEEGAKL